MRSLPPAASRWLRLLHGRRCERANSCPLLSYRTGPYGVNGTPWANGFADYLNLINERDGGINGVKIAFEEMRNGLCDGQGR